MRRKAPAEGLALGKGMGGGVDAWQRRGTCW